MRFARQIAAAAVTLGRYCKKVVPSSKLDSMRYCNISNHTTSINAIIHCGMKNTPLKYNNISWYLSLASVKSRMAYLSGSGLPRLSWKKDVKCM